MLTKKKTLVLTMLLTMCYYGDHYFYYIRMDADKTGYDAMLA